MPTVVFVSSKARIGKGGGTEALYCRGWNEKILDLGLCATVAQE